jgi:hypothetical protein
MPPSLDRERPAPTRLAGVWVMCLAMLLWPIVELLARFLSQPYSPFERSYGCVTARICS